MHLFSTYLLNVDNRIKTILGDKDTTIIRIKLKRVLEQELILTVRTVANSRPDLKNEHRQGDKLTIICKNGEA